jgi:hypothetical protein
LLRIDAILVPILAQPSLQGYSGQSKGQAESDRFTNWDGQTSSGRDLVERRRETETTDEERTTQQLTIDEREKLMVSRNGRRKEKKKYLVFFGVHG